MDPRELEARDANCTEVLGLLDPYVDAELDEKWRARVRPHLDRCLGCESAYRQTTQLKRLLQRKTRLPTLPGGLSARILRDVRRQAERRSGAGFRAAVTAMAAAVLVVVAGWLTLSVLLPRRAPLAHATVVREVASRFQSYADFGTPVVDYQTALREIRARTGVGLERFPVIPKARLVSWRAERILDRPCVCLSYENLAVRKMPAGKDRTYRPTIMIFAIPADGSRFEQKIHVCDCIEIAAGTIFCFRYGGTPMNLVTTLDRDEMHHRLESIVR